MNITKAISILIGLALGHSASAQYCIPFHSKWPLVPVISDVMFDNISNPGTTTPLTPEGYSDYTNLQTTISVGGSYNISVSTADFFGHNVAAWIDYDRNQRFDADELLDTDQLGGGSTTVALSFTVPPNVLNGATRLRIRAVAEPFGAWTNSNHPCAVVQDGETEDYTVIIAGGSDSDLAITRFDAPISAVGLSNELVSVDVTNNGNSVMNSASFDLFVDGLLTSTTNLTNPLSPGATANVIFPDLVDLTVISCRDIRVEMTAIGDALAYNDTLSIPVCALQPVIGNDVWYIHSDQFYPIETYHTGTTNQTIMDTIFGNGNWQLGYFETMDVAQVLSPSTCLIYIDGSFNDVDPLETFLTEHGTELENWVASGGRLMMNSSPESINPGSQFVMEWGFDGVRLVQGHDIAYAIPVSGHVVHSGPYQPNDNNGEWFAFNYSEAVLQGEGLTSIIVDDDDQHFGGGPNLDLPMVAEKIWGNGHVIFASVGPSQQFSSDPVSAMNSRFNIVDYLNDCDFSTTLQEQTQRSILLFPNPAMDLVTLMNGNEEPLGVIVLTDAVGKEVHRWMKVGHRADLDLRHVPSGMYQLTIRSHQGPIKTSKLILQR